MGRGWSSLDVLLVSGDAYIDHPAFGVAMIGRVLEAAGWRVGIIPQPDWREPERFCAMGRPRLFCAVTAGNLDSMVANYTAARHRRPEDSYSENGEIGKRPNHAAAVYAQLCKRAFPGVAVVLGGIEASLRRVAHYDYWENKIRPSILLDSKADILVYGMGERAILEIANRLDAGNHDLGGIRGTARLLGARLSASSNFSEAVWLPSWRDIEADSGLLLKLTKKVEAEQNPYCGRRLVQFHGDRAVVVEPPDEPMSQKQFDALYHLPFEKGPHPTYRGSIPTFNMIKDSVTVVRGCPGGCSFCGLGLHQGKFLVSRSLESVQAELSKQAKDPSFRGTITDLGGPTANLYGCQNGIAEPCRRCRRPSCLFPTICEHLHVEQDGCIALYRQSRAVPGIKHVFVQSGIRMDVALRTPEYLKELITHHVSGHLKVAPEHLDPAVLRLMRKPVGIFERFLDTFQKTSKSVGKEQFLVPYFISSFPGCTEDHMKTVATFLRRSNWKLQQVQDFIPLPMTPATAMYVTGIDYETGQHIPVTRNARERRMQLGLLRSEHGD
jgi:uncharacterized radical SAM protein YgiQ